MSGRWHLSPNSAAKRRSRYSIQLPNASNIGLRLIFNPPPWPLLVIEIKDTLGENLWQLLIKDWDWGISAQWLPRFNFNIGQGLSLVLLPQLLVGFVGWKETKFILFIQSINIQLNLISASVIWKKSLHQLSNWKRQSLNLCYFYETKSRGVQLRSILSVWSFNHKAFQISKSWDEYSRLFFETWWWRFASNVDIGFWHLLDLLPPLP